METRGLVQVLHPHQKYEHPKFWNGLSYGIKSGQITFNGMTSLLNFYKIILIGSKVIREHKDGHTQTKW
jgi:hypothetical protein